ncbi:MAG TPA: hypothetical protein VF828_03375 [Patescibacteria group bacterium]
MSCESRLINAIFLDRQAKKIALSTGISSAHINLPLFPFFYRLNSAVRFNIPKKALLN